MNLSISVDDKAVRAAFASAPEKVTNGINTWIHRTAALTERAAKIEEDRIDTGLTQSSIHTDFGQLTATVRPTTKYAIFVHEGRRPGKMPPYGPNTTLGRWATKRGMVPFLVARSIGRHGIKPDRFMDRAYATVKPQADADAVTILNEILL